MAISHQNLLFTILILSSTIHVHSRGPVYAPPDVERLTDSFSRLSVNESYSVFFGGDHVRVTSNGANAELSLDKSSGNSRYSGLFLRFFVPPDSEFSSPGSGLQSRNKYSYGFFNAAIKLPAGFTSGVVVAYYLSNADAFPHNHDEIDFELLGHEKRREWVLQTNMYGNGSVRMGREEKFYLWFDPTQSFHDYSILWNNHHIVFLVDNIPVREVVHTDAVSSAYPSKPMSVYTTIWDGSEWATHGGKYPVNYKYAPFVASMGGIQMEGCISKTKDMNPSCSRSIPSSLDPVDGERFAKLSRQQSTGLEWARRKHMFYSYCQDKSRYKVMPPECNGK